MESELVEPVQPITDVLIETKQTKSDENDVQIIFGILEAEFHKRIPEVTLIALEEKPVTRGWDYKTLAEFREEDAEEIVDIWLRPHNMRALDTLVEAKFLRVFIYPETKKSGKIRYVICMRWRVYCRNPCNVVKSWWKATKYEFRETPRLLPLMFLITILVTGGMIGAVIALVEYRKDHPLITLERDCEHIIQAAYEYSCLYYNNTSSSSSTGS